MALLARGARTLAARSWARGGLGSSGGGGSGGGALALAPGAAAATTGWMQQADAASRRWATGGPPRGGRRNAGPTEPPKVMTYESEPVTYLTGNDPAPEEPGEGAEPEEWAKYFEQKFVYDLDNYEAPKGMTEAQPMNFYDMDAYVESVKPDFETKPKGLEDVKLTYEFMIYQPYVGLFLKDKMQPNQKVRVTLQVDDLNLTETQMEFMKNLVGNRYKPRKNTLSFVSRKSDNVKDNMEHVKKLLSNVIAEIRKH